VSTLLPVVAAEEPA
nr:RecName: Full=Unknown protein from spot 245 of 2D-PAGE of etiolated coleoptile [Zea mays]